MTNQKIKIDQALHGYSNGHRLIESSTKFSKEVERTLLLMSDMSGPSMVKGFEDYISGYPLNDMLYAFSRTWYAFEMKRPGCVWTHTLIINSTDLSEISDLQALARLFKHPEIGNSNISYGGCIDLSNNYNYDLNDNLDMYTNSSNNFATKVLEGLYAHPEEPVYILSNNSKQYENLIIKIWSQQWPELRTAFYFCSGSISNRKLNNRIFDLQVIPLKNEKQVSREVPTGIYLEDGNENIPNKNTSWLSTAVNDLFDRNAIRTLLWKFAKNSKGGRKEYSGYLEIIDILNETNNNRASISHLTEKLCSLFPSPNDAINLKSTIYGGNKSNADIFPNILDEHLVLRELLTTKYDNSFNLQTLNVSERAKKLWQYNKWETQQLVSEIISINLNPLGEAFLSGISEVLEPDDLINLGNQNAPLFYVFLNLNPSLASSQILWDQSNINFNNLVEAVAKSTNLTKSVTRKIINAILDAGKNRVADDLERAFGEIAIHTFLEWLDKDSSISVSGDKYYEWKSVLGKNIKTVISWLNIYRKANYKTLAFLCKILNPNSSDVINLGADIWMPLARAEILSSNNIEIKAFLLALGFNNPNDGADRLVRMSFEEVHDAVEKNSLSYHYWHLIEQNVPSLSWWMNWDKCERLRRALVDKFIQYNWSAQEFLLSVNSDETFSGIVQYCKWDKKRQQFIKTIRNKVAHGEISATHAQMELIDNM